MTDITTKDRIWNTALKMAFENDQFTSTEIIENSEVTEKSRRTILRTLAIMEELGWIEQVKEQSQWWRAGDYIEKLRRENLSRLGPGYIVFVPDAQYEDEVTVNIDHVRDNFAYGDPIND